MTDNQWLASLKVGDEVAICCDYGRRWIIRRVAKTTATQIVVDNYSRFRRTNGVLVGKQDSFNRQSLHQVTDQIRESIKTESYVNGIRRFAGKFRGMTDSLPLEELQQIHVYLKSADDVWTKAKAAVTGD